MDHSLIAVGKKIRRVRQQQELTVQQLADRASVSKGLVSKVENGRTIPSLPVLFSLIRALNSDVSTFFEDIAMDRPPAYIHQRANDFEPFQKEDAVGFHYQQVLTQSFPSNAVEITVLTIDPGAHREMVTTDGQELLFLLEGDMVVRLNDDEIEVNEGDAFFFDGRIPHVPTNPFDRPARMLVVIFLKSV